MAPVYSVGWPGIQDLDLYILDPQSLLVYDRIQRLPPNKQYLNRIDHHYVKLKDILALFPTFKRDEAENRLRFVTCIPGMRELVFRKSEYFASLDTLLVFLVIYPWCASFQLARGSILKFLTSYLELPCNKCGFINRECLCHGGEHRYTTSDHIASIKQYSDSETQCDFKSDNAVETSQPPSDGLPLGPPPMPTESGVQMMIPQGMALQPGMRIPLSVANTPAGAPLFFPSGMPPRGPDMFNPRLFDPLMRPSQPFMFPQPPPLTRAPCGDRNADKNRMPPPLFPPPFSVQAKPMVPLDLPPSVLPPPKVTAPGLPKPPKKVKEPKEPKNPNSVFNKAVMLKAEYNALKEEPPKKKKLKKKSPFKLPPPPPPKILVDQEIQVNILPNTRSIAVQTRAMFSFSSESVTKGSKHLQKQEEAFLAMQMSSVSAETPQGESPTKEPAVPSDSTDNKDVDAPPTTPTEAKSPDKTPSTPTSDGTPKVAETNKLTEIKSPTITPVFLAKQDPNKPVLLLKPEHKQPVKISLWRLVEDEDSSGEETEDEQTDEPKLEPKAEDTTEPKAEETTEPKAEKTPEAIVRIIVDGILNKVCGPEEDKDANEVVDDDGPKLVIDEAGQKEGAKNEQVGENNGQKKDESGDIHNEEPMEGVENSTEKKEDAEKESTEKKDDEKAASDNKEMGAKDTTAGSSDTKSEDISSTDTKPETPGEKPQDGPVSNLEMLCNMAIELEGKKSSSNLVSIIKPEAVNTETPKTEPKPKVHAKKWFAKFEYLPTNEFLYRCTFHRCGQCFDTKKAALIHNKAHGSFGAEIPNKLECFECKKYTVSFSKWYDMIRHLKFCHNVLITRKRFGCTFCGLVFETEEQLNRHADHHYMGRYKCTHCGSFLFTWKQVERHKQNECERKDGKEKNLGCPYCSLVFHIRNMRNVHMLSHTDKGLVCTFCDDNEIWENWKELRKHYQQKHSAKIRSNVDPLRKVNIKQNPKCHVCEQEFKIYEDFCYHMKKRHDFIPYTLIDCEFCEKTFRSVKMFEWHQKNTHGKERRCEKCDFVAKSKTHMKAHMTSKHKEKALSCTECGKTFQFYHQLKVHLVQHARKSMYRCKKCGEEFDKQDKLRQHQRTHKRAPPPPKQSDEDKIYITCPECDFKTYTNYALRCHMRRKHPEYEEEEKAPPPPTTSSQYPDDGESDVDDPTFKVAINKPAKGGKKGRPRRKYRKSMYAPVEIKPKKGRIDAKKQRRLEIEKEKEMKTFRKMQRASCARTLSYDDHKFLKKQQQGVNITSPADPIEDEEPAAKKRRLSEQQDLIPPFDEKSYPYIDHPYYNMEMFNEYHYLKRKPSDRSYVMPMDMDASPPKALYGRQMSAPSRYGRGTAGHSMQKPYTHISNLGNMLKGQKRERHHPSIFPKHSQASSSRMPPPSNPFKGFSHSPLKGQSSAAELGVDSDLQVDEFSEADLLKVSDELSKQPDLLHDLINMIDPKVSPSPGRNNSNIIPPNVTQSPIASTSGSMLDSLVPKETEVNPLTNLDLDDIELKEDDYKLWDTNLIAPGGLNPANIQGSPSTSKHVSHQMKLNNSDQDIQIVSADVPSEQEVPQSQKSGHAIIRLSSLPQSSVSQTSSSQSTVTSTVSNETQQLGEQIHEGVVEETVGEQSIADNNAVIDEHGNVLVNEQNNQSIEIANTSVEGQIVEIGNNVSESMSVGELKPTLDDEETDSNTSDTEEAISTMEEAVVVDDTPPISSQNPELGISHFVKPQSSAHDIVTVSNSQPMHHIIKRSPHSSNTSGLQSLLTDTSPGRISASSANIVSVVPLSKSHKPSINTNRTISLGNATSIGQKIVTSISQPQVKPSSVRILPAPSTGNKQVMRRVIPHPTSSATPPIVQVNSGAPRMLIPRRTSAEAPGGGRKLVPVTRMDLQNQNIRRIVRKVVVSQPQGASTTSTSTIVRKVVTSQPPGVSTSAAPQHNIISIRKPSTSSPQIIRLVRGGESGATVVPTGGNRMTIVNSGSVENDGTQQQGASGSQAEVTDAVKNLLDNMQDL